MKTKISVLLVLCVIVLSSSVNKFRPDGEYVKKNIPGSWKFSKYWNPYGNDDDLPPTAEHRNTLYHFDSNGVVTIWSADSTNKGTQTYTWGISSLKDNKGKEYTVVKVVDASIEPGETAKIEASTSGISFIVVQISDDFMTWIPMKSYGKTTLRDRQNAFGKVSGLLPPK